MKMSAYFFSIFAPSIAPTLAITPPITQPTGPAAIVAATVPTTPATPTSPIDFQRPHFPLPPPHPPCHFAGAHIYTYLG